MDDISKILKEVDETPVTTNILKEKSEFALFQQKREVYTTIWVKNTPMAEQLYDWIFGGVSDKLCSMCNGTHFPLDVGSGRYTTILRDADKDEMELKGDDPNDPFSTYRYINVAKCAPIDILLDDVDGTGTRVVPYIATLQDPEKEDGKIVYFRKDIYVSDWFVALDDNLGYTHYLIFKDFMTDRVSRIVE